MIANQSSAAIFSRAIVANSLGVIVANSSGAVTTNSLGAVVANSSGPGPLNSFSERSVRWSYIRSVRAAIAAWHSSRGLPSALDAWTPRMLAFWEGLKRRSVHAVTNKSPLSFDVVRQLLLMGASSWSQCSSAVTSFSEVKPLLIDLRTAATVAVAFFGVRRAAEVADTLLHHLSTDASGALVISAPRQKNDQLGRGQAAIIPPFPSWGSACPTRIILAWRDARAWVKKLWDKHDRILIDSAPRSKASWFFLSLSGPSWGGRLGPDAIREAFRKKCALDGPAPSPRKGGVRFYRAMGVNKDVVQVQGGWKSDAVMSGIYDGFGAQEVILALNDAARSADRLVAAEQILLRWGNLREPPPDKAHLLSKLHAALPDISTTLAFSYGPSVRASLSAALKSWDLPQVSSHQASAAIVHLRSLERDRLRLEKQSGSVVALSQDNLASLKRPRSADSSVE